jgi:hypothetical protein
LTELIGYGRISVQVGKTMNLVRMAAGLVLAAVAACGQAPVITSVVNAASYQPTQFLSGNEPATITTIFGAKLADTTAASETNALPIQLGGTTVTVGGVAAKLFYVSPGQINFLTPGQGAVVVTTAAGSSAPYDPSTATPNTWVADGIFSVNASGCGRGAVLNNSPYGGPTVNSPSNSAAPGDWISIYGTGDWPGRLYFDFGGLINEEKYGDYTWIGVAPGFAGLYQGNFQIPSSVREGCAVPIRGLDQGTTQAFSQPVTIAIHGGRGQCVDPPQAGYGQVLWQKTVSTTATGVASETDTLVASFESSPGKTAPLAPVYTDLCPPPNHVCAIYLPPSNTYFGPSCPVPGYRGLDAGEATIQGPGLSLTPVPFLPYQDGQLGGLTAYQATLPAGTIRAGTFTFSAAGGADLGQFHAALPIGADVQIQTALAGVIVSNCTPLTVNWTGGDPNAWVTVRLVYQQGPSVGGYQYSFIGDQTRASAGTMTLPVEVPGGIPCGVGAPVTMIVVEEDPDPSEILTISAPGLSLGGQATWKYVHTYEAGASN